MLSLVYYALSPTKVNCFENLFSFVKNLLIGAGELKKLIVTKGLGNVTYL